MNAKPRKVRSLRLEKILFRKTRMLFKNHGYLSRYAINKLLENLFLISLQAV